MCGIIGYVGCRNATPILLDGLKRLEYRGYDSAGIAIAGHDRSIDIRRSEGKLECLEALVASEPLSGRLGIGHTRWATHGKPSERNAHPHRSGDIVVVHNGIIENYLELKKFLASRDYSFTSETDTEFICHLVHHLHVHEKLPLFEAVQNAISRLKGSYALVIMGGGDRCLYAARKGGPLVAGTGKGEMFIASDIPALLPYTKEMIFLEDGDLAKICAEGIEIFGEDGKKRERAPRHIPWTPLMAEKGGYKHFMLKEIFEQPQAIEDTMRGRLDSDRGHVFLEDLESFFSGKTLPFDKINIVACGTSWHAGLVGKYFIEALARMQVAVDLASEFRYREPLLDAKTLVLSISQSGETLDTLYAQSISKDLGAQVMAICNVVGSSIARHAGCCLYTHAGPEIGVASTKAFTAQLLAIHLFALRLAAAAKRISAEELSAATDELLTLPRLMKRMLGQEAKIQKIAKRISDASHVLFIGRGSNYPVALEGALKLKEISYVHAEGFAAGELKHGPIALIDEGVPVIAIAPRDATYEKTMSNVEEVRARGASVIALVTEGDQGLSGKADHIIEMPTSSRYLTPILASIPLQLLAYHVADYKGTDVDQPRNLAKSVTVE